MIFPQNKKTNQQAKSFEALNLAEFFIQTKHFKKITTKKHISATIKSPISLSVAVVKNHRKTRISKISVISNAARFSLYKQALNNYEKIGTELKLKKIKLEGGMLKW